MKKFIFIPVVNNFDLLEKAVRSVKQGIYDDYIIFNNSGTIIPAEVYSGTSFWVWTPDHKMTFMQTQNAMRNHAIGNNYDYYSFMHNDGEINDDSDVRLINYVESIDEPWGVVFTHYDVFCAFSTEAVKAVGEWGDSKWPEQSSGYFLDNDYYRRLRKANYKEFQIVDCQISHFASNTIKDPEQNNIWIAQQEKVVEHYRIKWGNLPPNEVYDIPFNGAEQ